jgi:DNA modification methylase
MNFSAQIETYIRDYQKHKKPISVSFRKIIPSLNNSDRFTHLIHTYPAKLLPHIPYFFLNNEILSLPNDKVLDSFCGSGTVLLESALAGRIPIGADSNPLARLISRTKITSYEINLLREIQKEIISSIDKRRKVEYPYIVNVDYWFLPSVKNELALIREAINKISNQSYRDFFNLCFSNLVKKVSLADPRVSVPVRLNPNRYPIEHALRKESKKILKSLEEIDVRKRFNEIIEQNIKRFEKLNVELTRVIQSNVTSSDARNLISSNGWKLRSESVQLFVSSPPYSGAQKYIRSSSLSLGWLGFIEEETILRKLEEKSIGREHYYTDEFSHLKKTGVRSADLLLEKIFKMYPKRAHIASNYLLEMRDSFKESIRVLKKNGYFVLVIGNNQICGYEFKTQEYLSIMLESLGMQLVFKLIDDIRSYGLMTKRNKTANIITREYILVFQKKLA